MINTEGTHLTIEKKGQEEPRQVRDFESSCNIMRELSQCNWHMSSLLMEKIFSFLQLLVSIKTFSNIKLKFTSIRAAQNTKRSKDNLILESAGKVDWHLFGMEVLLKS